MKCWAVCLGGWVMEEATWWWRRLLAWTHSRKTRCARRRRGEWVDRERRSQQPVKTECAGRHHKHKACWEAWADPRQNAVWELGSWETLSWNHYQALIFGEIPSCRIDCLLVLLLPVNFHPLFLTCFMGTLHFPFFYSYLSSSLNIAIFFFVCFNWGIIYTV